MNLHKKHSFSYLTKPCSSYNEKGCASVDKNTCTPFSFNDKNLVFCLAENRNICCA